MIPWDEADRKLREAAQLWALGRRLPHVPTPSEKQLELDFFAASFVGDPRFSTAAARAEIRSLWARRDYAQILNVERMLSEEHLKDLDIRMYLRLARQLAQARG